jgi:enolase-phosphatase E1
VSVSLSALHIRVVVLDIEGTTTPVDFVYQVLFPYARAHVPAFLSREWDSAACREAVSLLGRERAAEAAAGRLGTNVAQGVSPVSVAQDFSPADVVSYVRWLMDRDSKSPGLKALQGLIWQAGYRSGELRGSVYPDVPPALERWRARGRDVYIYSSGSVLAQQLLFGSTEAGDLTRLFHGYFDTAVGPKQSVESYGLILERIHVAPPEALFVSDVVGELDAARTAGLHTALCMRGAATAPAGLHPVIRSFDEITD